jgi:hypothetical protein
MSEQYYEKLYKVEGDYGKVFCFVSTDKDDPIFKDFPKDDEYKRYWVESTPRKVRSI